MPIVRVKTYVQCSIMSPMFQMTMVMSVVLVLYVREGTPQQTDARTIRTRNVNYVHKVHFITESGTYVQSVRRAGTDDTGHANVLPQVIHGVKDARRGLTPS